MYNVTITPGQTIIDIAIQEYGDPTFCVEIVLDNGLNSINDDLTPGSVLQMQNIDPSDKLRTYLKAQNIQRNSHEGTSSGIGDMEIGDDFIVR